jgi:hypothetical protein
MGGYIAISIANNPAYGLPANRDPSAMAVF